MAQWSGGPNDQYRHGGPPLRRRRSAWVGVVATVAAFVVVLGLGAGGWLLWQSVRGGGGDEARAGDGATLEVLKKDHLTAQDLRGVDPVALFYASFKRMATQPVVHLTEESYRERSAYEKGTGGYVWESGFDYRTKQWRVAWGSTRADDPITVCIDGKSYLYSYNLKKWQGPAANDIFCRQKNAYRFITDGLSTGGMTDAQAEAWIRDLQKDYEGFVNPGQPQLAEVKGRQYLRLVVDYKPVKRADGRYYGGQALMWSFKTSGLDPQSHPYYYNGAMGTGYHVIYYIEPRSLMTAYSEVEQTPVLDESGRPREGGDWYKVRVEYHLPGKMPGMKASGRPVRPKLTWPRDQA